jgi:alanine-synthesizing transaminase
VPTPSYPLLDHLAALEGLETLPYRLDPHDDWRPRLPDDPASVVIAVHPNNPTGSYLPQDAAEALAQRCRRDQAALVADEVFHAYPLAGPPPPSFACREDLLLFVLGGLSKYAGLPQLKLAWTVVRGPEQLAGETMDRLAFLADQYLSVSTPVQLALPSLLRRAAPIRSAILARCRENLEILRTAASRWGGTTVVPPQGGWSVVIRYPGVLDEERLALELLHEDGVAVHPGYFYDLQGAHHLVISLLPPPTVFAEGARRVMERVARASESRLGLG